MRHVASIGCKFQFWRASESLYGLHKPSDMVWANEWTNMQLSNQWLTEEMTRQAFNSLEGRSMLVYQNMGVGIWKLNIFWTRALEWDKQKRRRTLPLPCKELQINERGTESTDRVTDSSWKHPSSKCHRWGSRVTNCQQYQFNSWSQVRKLVRSKLTKNSYQTQRLDNHLMIL